MKTFLMIFLLAGLAVPYASAHESTHEDGRSGVTYLRMHRYDARTCFIQNGRLICTKDAGFGCRHFELKVVNSVFYKKCFPFVELDEDEDIPVSTLNQQEDFE